MERKAFRVLVSYKSGMTVELSVQVSVKVWGAVIDIDDLRSSSTCVERYIFYARHCASFKFFKTCVN